MTPIGKCPHCGNQVTPNTRFCAACGSSLVPLTGPADPTGVVSGPVNRQSGFGPMQLDAVPIASPYGNSPGLTPTIQAMPMDDKNRTIINFLAVAVVLLTITVGSLAIAWHKASLSGSQPCVVGPGLGPDAPPGAGQANLPSPSGFGDDPRTAQVAVIDYLNFIQAIDQRRVELQSRVPAATTTAADGSAATSTAASADSSGTVADSGAQAPTPAPGDGAAPVIAPQSTDGLWQQLIVIFQTFAPPASCSTLQADYLNLLIDSKAASGKSATAETASTALGGDATKAESDMNSVCSDHHLTSSFMITVPTSPPPPSNTP